jgi:hypothetical protein
MPSAQKEWSAAHDGPFYTALAQRPSTLKIITGHTLAVLGVASAPTGTGWPVQAGISRCGCGQLRSAHTKAGDRSMTDH